MARHDEIAKIKRRNRWAAFGSLVFAGLLCLLVLVLAWYIVVPGALLAGLICYCATSRSPRSSTSSLDVSDESSDDDEDVELIAHDEDSESVKEGHTNERSELLGRGREQPPSQRTERKEEADEKNVSRGEGNKLIKETNRFTAHTSTEEGPALPSSSSLDVSDESSDDDEDSESNKEEHINGRSILLSQERQQSHSKSAVTENKRDEGVDLHSQIKILILKIEETEEGYWGRQLLGIINDCVAKMDDGKKNEFLLGVRNDLQKIEKSGSEKSEGIEVLRTRVVQLRRKLDESKFIKEEMGLIETWVTRVFSPEYGSEEEIKQWAELKPLIEEGLAKETVKDKEAFVTKVTEDILKIFEGNDREGRINALREYCRTFRQVKLAHTSTEEKSAASLSKTEEKRDSELKGVMEAVVYPLITIFQDESNRFAQKRVQKQKEFPALLNWIMFAEGMDHRKKIKFLDEVKVKCQGIKYAKEDGSPMEAGYFPVGTDYKRDMFEKYFNELVSRAYKIDKEKKEKVDAQSKEQEITSLFDVLMKGQPSSVNFSLERALERKMRTEDLSVILDELNLIKLITDSSKKISKLRAFIYGVEEEKPTEDDAVSEEPFKSSLSDGSASGLEETKKEINNIFTWLANMADKITIIKIEKNFMQGGLEDLIYEGTEGPNARKTNEDKLEFIRSIHHDIQGILEITSNKEKWETLGCIIGERLEREKFPSQGFENVKDRYKQERERRAKAPLLQQNPAQAPSESMTSTLSSYARSTELLGATSPSSLSTTEAKALDSTPGPADEGALLKKIHQEVWGIFDNFHRNESLIICSGINSELRQGLVKCMRPNDSTLSKGERIQIALKIKSELEAANKMGDTKAALMELKKICGCEKVVIPQFNLDLMFNLSTEDVELDPDFEERLRVSEPFVPKQKK